MIRRLLAAFALLLPLAAHADPVVLKFAFFAPESEMTWVTTLKPFIDAVNKDGAGVVRIDPYPNGELGRAIPNQPQLLLDGVADITFAIPGNSPGRFPDDTVVELPGLFRDIRESTLVWTRLLASENLRGFQDYHVLAGLGTPPFSIHTRPPLTKLADLKGMKIRTTNATEGSALRTLGAVPILLPVNEVPEAIGRGTIDGSTVHPVPMFDFGLNRVTKYDYFNPLGISPLVVIMNKQKYDSLSPAARAIIDKHAGEVMDAVYIKNYGGYEDALTAKLQADTTRHVTIASPAEQAEARKDFKPVIDEWVAKDPRNAALYAKVLTLISQVRAAP